MALGAEGPKQIGDLRQDPADRVARPPPGLNRTRRPGRLALLHASTCRWRSAGMRERHHPSVADQRQTGHARRPLRFGASDCHMGSSCHAVRSVKPGHRAAIWTSRASRDRPSPRCGPCSRILWPRGDRRSRISGSHWRGSCLVLAKVATDLYPAHLQPRGGRALPRQSPGDGPAGADPGHMASSGSSSAAFRRAAGRGVRPQCSSGPTRRVALDTFRHMHGLSLRFHLDRQTGGAVPRD